MNESVRRRVVVTGGAGFIGSTLVDRLLDGGWTVTVVDCFESFYGRDRKQRNVSRAVSHPAYTLAEVDTRDQEALIQAFEKAAPDVVVDLAARAGVRPSLENPQLYIDINVRGLSNTLAATARTGARLVFASSSSVYGDDDRRPFRESQMRARPESPYGATKIAGEALVYAHHVATGLPISIARLFTVYGPRQRPDLAIHDFARRMLSDEPIHLYDHGRGLRDYTYVDDVVDAFVRLIAWTGDPLTVNIGSHAPVTTTEMVDALERALGVQARRVSEPAQPGDVPATYADISRAKEALGWEPRWDFLSGIASFTEWLRKEGTPGTND